MTSGDIKISLGLLAKSSIMVFMGVLLSKIFTYVYRIVIARYFGPEVYGLFSLAVIILGIGVALTSFGLPEGLLRYLSLNTEKKNLPKSKYLFGLSLKICIVSSLVGALILFFLSEFIAVSILHNENLTIFLKVFSWAIPFSVIGAVFLSTIRAYEKIKMYSFIVNIFQNGFRLIMLAILLIAGFGISAILSSHVVAMAATLIISYFGSKKIIEKIKKSKKLTKKNRILKKEFFAYSWPIMFLLLINSIFYWTDSLVVGSFRNATEVGFYSVSFTIVALLGVVPELFMQLFFPLISREYSKNNLTNIKEISKQVTKWIYVLNIPVFVILLFFPGAVINILFGNDFLAGETALRILAVGGIFSSTFITVLNNLLSVKGKSRLLLYNLLVVSVFNLILSILLVRTYGINGAAISTTISWILMSIALSFEVKKYFKMLPFRRKIMRVVAAATIPTFLLISLKSLLNNSLPILVLALVLFLLSYVLFIFMFKALDENDIATLKNIKDSVKSKMVKS